MAFLTLLRKRLLGLLLVVFGVSLITFTISHLIPGDPARLIAGDRASDALVAGIRHQLGLDLPLYQQYGRYVLDLVQGDLGTSIRTNRPVLEDLQAFFPATLELALVALFLAILVGVPTYGSLVLQHLTGGQSVQLSAHIRHATRDSQASRLRRALACVHHLQHPHGSAERRFRTHARRIVILVDRPG